MKKEKVLKEAMGVFLFSFNLYTYTHTHSHSKWHYISFSCFVLGFFPPLLMPPMFTGIMTVLKINTEIQFEFSSFYFSPQMEVTLEINNSLKRQLSFFIVYSRSQKNLILECY